METQAEQPPRLGGIQAGPALAGVLYALLVGSAALALWARESPLALPARVAKAAPWVFLAFIVCFAAYRLALVRAGKYSAFKAFFQIGAACLFFVLLLPAKSYRTAPPEDPLAELMMDSNPHVRALAAEVARSRPDGHKYGSLLVRAMKDPDPEVREQAHRSLVVLTGTDLGAPDTEGAIQKWGERYP
ncbi:MAG: hypothetical protein IRZ16_10100 [Myxococcaceae bacterium]|nr:hypothetical protein [Myxococcaceae bacterium]